MGSELGDIWSWESNGHLNNPFCASESSGDAKSMDHYGPLKYLKSIDSKTKSNLSKPISVQIPCPGRRSTLWRSWGAWDPRQKRRKPTGAEAFLFFFTVKTWWNHLIWSKIWGLTDLFWCLIMDDECCDPRLRSGPGFGHRWFWAVLVHILVLAKWNHMFFSTTTCNMSDSMPFLSISLDTSRISCINHQEKHMPFQYIFSNKAIKHS